MRGAEKNGGEKKELKFLGFKKTTFDANNNNIIIIIII